MYVNRREQGEGDDVDDMAGAQLWKRFDEAEVLDFVNGIETLNVVVERPVAGCRPMDINGMGDAESYTLPSKGTKGLALVLNIVEYDDDITNVYRRYGSEQDVEYLTDLFIQLDYKLYPRDQKQREQKNKSKLFLQSLIRQFKIECKRLRPKSIIIFIGSHGKYPNQILTSDYQWMDLYKDIVHAFAQDPNFSELGGKPKIFLVQACQSYTNRVTTTTHDNVHHGPLSLIKDVYICMATMPGEPAKRHFYKGSWFPYCFTYMMMKHALKMTSLQQIMEMVKTMLGQIKNNTEFKQVPSNISINFDKPLYFVGSDYNLSGVRNYHKIPSWLQGAPKLCIVKTLDIQITIEKLRETLPKCVLHEWKDFLEFVSSSHCQLDEGMVDVVRGCTVDELELTLVALKEVAREQVILVTDDDAQKLRKLGVDIKMDDMKLEDLSPAYVWKIKERLENKYEINLNAEKLNLNGELLVDIISGREMFHDEIKPRQLSYYVNRSMLTRNVISSELFKGSYCNDIFLVHGIKRCDLSLLVKNGITGMSQEQLKNITVTFMTLDKTSHFDKICKMTCKSVHMLNYEEGKFRWIRSNGSIWPFQKHVEGEQDEQMEENFCSLISSESAAPVCISDSPGMGKTILLAHIGRRLRRMFPNRTVLFVELSMFIQRVRESKITDEAQSIEKALQDIVCKTLLGRHILKSKLTSGKVCVELLLDGFDEVRSTEIDFAHGILKTLRSTFPSIRMWVTSRPHKLEELEVTLGGLGYNIKPFQKKDQVHFLMRLWSQHEKLNTPRLEDFARHCLKSLKRTMNAIGQDIAGIPLHCLLIGEVYEDNAMEHAKIGEESSPLPDEFHVSSITILYQEVINKKIRKYKSTFGSHRSPNDKLDNRGVINWLISVGGMFLGKNTSSRELRCELSEGKLNDIHAHLGISQLYPDMFRTLHHSFDPLDMEEILNVGIWEFATTTGPRFIHRTFVEYFAAVFIVDKLKTGTGWTKSLTEYLTNCALQRKDTLFGEVVFGHPFSEVPYSMIAYFLNSLLVTNSGVILSPPAKVANDINELLDNSEFMRQLVYVCVYKDYGNICKFLDHIGALGKYAGVIFDKGFFEFAMTISDLELFRLGFHHFENHHQEGIPLYMQCKLLVQAVKMGKFSKLEFLINDKGLRGIVETTNENTKMLLHYCIAESNADKEAKIDQKIDILRMLDGINGDLKEQTDEWGNTPLLADHAHARLLRELIHLGASIMTRNRNNETALHFRYHLSTAHYHDLVMTLEESGNLAELVPLKDNFQRTPLHTVIYSFDPLVETLQMFKDAGADFNCTDGHQRSVLMAAVRSPTGPRDVSTLRNLIKFGADEWIKTEAGNTLLHEVADQGSEAVEILNFLAKEHKLDVNAKNANGYTPLDIVLGSRVGIGANYFELGLTLFELGGRDTNTVNQWQKDQIFNDDDISTIYVDMLLLHLYIFGSDETTKWSSRSIMDKSPALTFPINYKFVEKLLISRGATDRRNGPIRRLKDILIDNLRRIPSIWDMETIQLFDDGKLV